MLSSSVAAADGSVPVPGLRPRRVAWELLQAVAAGAYADVALERALRQNPMSGADRGLVMELAYGAIRQRQWLDAWLVHLKKSQSNDVNARLAGETIAAINCVRAKTE